MNDLFNKSLFLAPMAGVNDPVFRLICKRMGADLTYTEMISAKGMSYGNARTFDMLTIEAGEKPVAVQLFGSEPEVLARQAAEIEQRLGSAVALIDINMGCPARKIAGKGEGAALMKDPQLARCILEAVVGAVETPVTVKFRKGYGLAEDTAVEFARMAEQAGVFAVAVHGRCAEQLYHGKSDREIVGRVKQAVQIPVIASGDVFCQQDIEDYLDVYHADAVMVARGAQGNPWIFSGVKPSLEQRVCIAREHACGLAQLFPRRLSSMRKHIAWYFKGMPQASAIRTAIQTCSTIHDYQALLDRIELSEQL
jgi:nifR3 family TIM-barrel protein